MKSSQRGGFVVGFIVGLLIGLALALGVALYVTKVPIPFINKVQQRTPEQDAAEAERNRNWDPNAPLAGKPTPPPARPPASVPGPAATPPQSTRDPAAILSGQSPGTPAASAPRAASTKPVSDAFLYFVQAGAYGKPEDAEQQRARLAMMGLGAKVTEREQNGRTVYRVRLGPFDKRDEAEAAQERLNSSGVDAALVRVER